MSGSTISSNELANRFNGRFRMRHKIGEGGLGKVLIVEDLWLKQDTALKISDMTDTGMDMREEVLALRRVPKDRYVSVFDYVKDGDYCGYTMEVLDDPWVTLKTFHEEKIRPLFEKDYITALKYVIFIVYDLLVSLEKLHGLKGQKLDRWVHGDIKPENLWVNKVGVNAAIKEYCMDAPFLPLNDQFSPFTKIGDLGLTVESGGRFIGHTPGYEPPEQEKGDSSPQSDIFSLGQTLIELIIDEKSGNKKQRDQRIITRLIRGKIPSKYLARKLAKIISTMLKSHPGHRKTCIDIRTMLREMVEQNYIWEIIEIFSGGKSMKISDAGEALFDEIKKSSSWQRYGRYIKGVMQNSIKESRTQEILRLQGQFYSLIE